VSIQKITKMEIYKNILAMIRANRRKLIIDIRTMMRMKKTKINSIEMNIIIKLKDYQWMT
jgi:hypothetical protein